MASKAGMVKVTVVEANYAASNAAISTEEDNLVFNTYGAIEPYWKPRALCRMFVDSASLRPNIDVYKTNIDGYGHRLKTTIDVARIEMVGQDVKAPDGVREDVKDALTVDKMLCGDTSPEVPSLAVDGALRLLPTQARLERLRVEQFFSSCCAEMSFTELRECRRMDLEVTGNAYWEILRDAEGVPYQIVHLPSVTMRLMAVDPCPHELLEKRRVSKMGLRQRMVRRRMRRFIQVLNGVFVAYFKEFGDPRIMSANTGKFYESIDQMRENEPESRVATEVQHFRIHSPVGAYGVPRWVGAALAVLGSHESEEVNYNYFQNKAVPPMAIMVSGGKLANGAAAKIETYIRDQLKGKDNFHKIMILEAEGTAGTVAGGQGARVRIEMKSLMDAQQQDALFQVYDANNTEKVGAQFRLPKILRGDMKDFNRATAEAALEYAEQQIFQPERNHFDFWMNDRFFPELDVKYHEFVTNSVVTKDPPSITKMVADIADAGGLTVNEVRELAADVFGKTYEPLEADWANEPLRVVLAKLQAESHAKPASSGAPGEAVAQQASQLMQLREALTQADTRRGERALVQARSEEAEKILLVPRDVFDSWLARDAG